MENVRDLIDWLGALNMGELQEKTLGVIYVYSRVTSREFSNKDLRFFDALAVALSISLENARLVQEALERQRLQDEGPGAPRARRPLPPPRRAGR